MVTVSFVEISFLRAQGKTPTEKIVRNADSFIFHIRSTDKAATITCDFDLTLIYFCYAIISLTGPFARLKCAIYLFIFFFYEDPQKNKQLRVPT